MRNFIAILFAVFVSFLGPSLGLTPKPSAAIVEEKEVLAAMRKATDFMMKTVSNRGGFLYHYFTDNRNTDRRFPYKQWGEVPARKSQIWVQPQLEPQIWEQTGNAGEASTTTVGLMLLDAYKVTGDPQYLAYAEKVAGALIWGQHRSGGWNYLIDFDPAGLQEWYEKVASQCRGWEEFYYNYDNATFDNNTTASAIRSLLRLYHTTLDPKYRLPLLKALSFVLEAQYPNGAWPQRYPLRRDFSFEGHPDYTSYYTFNDDVIANNIYLLLEAYEELGNEEYKKAARRGMDFYIISQLPSPQAGWADQYDMEMKPAWARSYEPTGVNTYHTVRNIRNLQVFYRITGDRRYLEPIPPAIQWLENSVIKPDLSQTGVAPGGKPVKYTHAIYYEVGTNKPLYMHHKHRKRPDGKFEITHYWVDHDPTEIRIYNGGAAGQIDIQAIKTEFERVSLLSLEQAAAEYLKMKETSKAVSETDVEEVRKLIASLDGRGAWMTEITLLDTLDYICNPEIKDTGIDTGTYVFNMYQLMNYLKGRTGVR
ncbi:pectate lyase [Acidobacteria bacterium AH-259-G07]|nr:pectate lyase [Acidobacteria bacterium AH-259-G07]